MKGSRMKMKHFVFCRHCHVVYWMGRRYDLGDEQGEGTLIHVSNSQALLIISEDKMELAMMPGRSWQNINGMRLEGR